VPRSRVWEKAVKNIESRALWLEQRPPRSLEESLGIEGIIASDYFREWSGLELKWRGIKRSPIPQDWHKYTSRAALLEPLTRFLSCGGPPQKIQILGMLLIGE
jgi:hypothetical protein